MGMYGSLGSVAVSSELDAWCSPTHVRGTCKPVSGQAKPMTHAALDKFRTFQGQLNRAASVKNLPTIGVDGVIGPASVALYNKLTGWTSTVDALAGAVLIGQATAQIKSLADQGGAPAVVKSPPTSQKGAAAVAEVIPGSSPEDFAAEQSITTKVTNFLASPWGIGGAVVLAAGAIFLVTRKRKPKSNPGRRRRKRSR